jgi:putative transposase
MMDTHLTEQELRREAIRRRLSGEPRQAICDALHRSTSWFDKWWAAYQDNPRIDFSDRSRVPLHSPTRTGEAVVQAIVSSRKILEAATTPGTRYGLIGGTAIQERLDSLGLESPSASTIQRILQDHSLTHPIGAGNDSAYYPWLEAWGVNAIQATDIITKHIRGGETIENFHTLDHYSHAVSLTPVATKNTTITRAHLVATWSKLGFPQLHQFDNEATFNGGHTHPRVIGQVVRLCLFCGIEPVFTPFYEAKRNYQIETFHSLWVKAFWSRHEFRHLGEVLAELPLFERWYAQHYRPPMLRGKTSTQMRQGVLLVRLTRELQRLIPTGRLPITAGRIHFMRKVQPTGEIELLNETWLVGEKWIGEYVRATINTQGQVLTIWHKADEASEWHLLKTRQFRLQEAVQPLLPAFRRNRTRCLDYLPD